MENSPPPFRLLVGLGNPGPEYERTRHNIGFMVLDELARESGVPFRAEGTWQAELARSGEVRLCKPQTYMNLSGETVGALSRFFKIEPGETLVILDDAALPLGRLRLRDSGSAGGHNGLHSIIQHLGTERVPRLRIGIGAAAGAMTGHVLGTFTAQEAPAVAEVVGRAAEAVTFAQLHGLERAMNKFNASTPAT